MKVKHIDFPSAEKFIGTGVTSATGYEVAVGAYTIGIKVVAVSTIDRSFTIAGSITEEGKSLFPVSVAAKKVAYTEHLFGANWQNQDVANWYDETVKFLNREFSSYMTDTYLTSELDTESCDCESCDLCTEVTPAKEEVVEEVPVIPEVATVEAVEVVAEEPKKSRWKK